jgi:hypothetical protein
MRDRTWTMLMFAAVGLLLGVAGYAAWKIMTLDPQ